MAWRRRAPAARPIEVAQHACPVPEGATALSPGPAASFDLVIRRDTVTAMPGRLSMAVLLAFFAAGCTPVADPPAAEATRRPSPSPRASPSPASSVAGSSSSPAATATLAPVPPPNPDAPETLELQVTGCPGGVVVDWSPALHPEFHHYFALRSIQPEVDPAYPPIAPAVDWGDSYATDRFITSAVDATLIPSDTDLYYRVMGYDEVNRVVAASPVRHANLTEVVNLGPLVIEPGEEAGSTLLDWTLFGGLGRCFSAYHVLIGPFGTTPGSTLTVMSDQSTTELETIGLHPGASYAIQVRALRTTTLGDFVVAQTEVAGYTVP